MFNLIMLTEAASNLPMEQQILLWVLGIVGTAVTGLVGWGVTVFTTWLSTKIKDQKAVKMISDIMQIVTDAVMEVFQTYVEALKNTGKFDEAAQVMAKEKAMKKIMARLTDKMKNYISENYGDIQQWLSDKIESTIYQLKR